MLRSKPWLSQTGLCAHSFTLTGLPGDALDNHQSYTVKYIILWLPFFLKHVIWSCPLRNNFDHRLAPAIHSRLMTFSLGLITEISFLLCRWDQVSLMTAWHQLFWSRLLFSPVHPMWITRQYRDDILSHTIFQIPTNLVESHTSDLAIYHFEMTLGPSAGSGTDSWVSRHLTPNIRFKYGENPETTQRQKLDFISI